MPEPRLIPIVELTMARLREFLREPEAVFWVFAFPLLMAFALGIAFRQERAQEVVVGVVRHEASTLGQQLKDAKGIRVRTLEPGEVDAALRRGQVAVVLVPGPPLVYRFDPSRPESRTARLVVDDVLQRQAGRVEPIASRDETVLAPGSRYIDWLIPGLLGMNIMGTSLWSIGFSVVHARSRKLLKRLMATPMPRVQYLASHLLARLVFLVLEAAALLVFAWLVFGVRPAGSIALVAGLVLLGALAFSGLGLLIATRATTIEGVSGWMNVVMMPMWLLSGVFFASSNFPDAAQPIIRLLPLTALVDALRGVMLEGYGAAAIGREIATLTICTVATFGLSVKLFRWR
ncbi:MAG: ABC transporter permease [Vicinamibacteraceae bacterium]